MTWISQYLKGCWVSYPFLRWLLRVEDLKQLISVVAVIEARRVIAVESILDLLDHVRDTLCKQSSCTFACSAVLLDSLVRHMHQAGLTELRADHPFSGYSID